MKTATKVLETIIEIVCFCAISCAIYFLLENYRIERQAENYASEYKELLTEDENGRMSLEELQKLNPDAAAWIEIYDTTLDYPIMKGKPEYTYLNRDFLGNNCITGSLYIRNIDDRYFTDEYEIVYGHHMANGGMLGCLDYFADPAYLQAHNKGQLITEKETYDVEVLTLIITDSYNDTLYTNNEREYFYNAMENATVLTGSLPERDKEGTLLLFSTCSASGNTDRTILITRLTKQM